MTNQIITTNDNIEFISPAMAKKGIAFFFASWSADAWDRVGLEIFRRGNVQITKELFRAHLIDEIYKLEEDGTDVYEQMSADEIAELLSDYWTNEELFEKQVLEWMAQDRQARLDVAHGAPAIPETPPPMRRVSPRRGAQAAIIATEVALKSQRMRDLQVEMMDYQRVQEAVVVRLSIVGWTGLKTRFNRVDGIVDEETFRAMRKEIGDEIYADLRNGVFAQQGIDETEVGNSDLPANGIAEKPSSPTPKTGSEPSDGSLTESSTEPTRPGESDQITTASSNSTSGSTGATKPVGDGPSKAAGDDSPAA